MTVRDLFKDQLAGCGGNSIPVEHVQRVLGLVPVPYIEILSSRCWLAGGRVLRWLTEAGGDGGTPPRAGDYDLFFPSLEALNDTAGVLLSKGFTLTAYQSFPRTIRELNEGGFRHEEKKSLLLDDAGRLRRITPDLCREMRLSLVELRSPGEEIFQLICTIFPDPYSTIMGFDFTICQLAIDDRRLTFGPRTPEDLVDRRIKVHRPIWPGSLLKRLRKFQARGFRAPAGTTLYIYTVTYLCKAYARTRLTGEMLFSK
ncbi:MAG: hypothetical protein U5R46_17680 [Gammaproteobacteria bacterium]|nr:hypothetical protein [Gammaproteobacteria bacterium]